MTNTALTAHPRAFVGATFRPWNVDALATVTHVNQGGVTIRYDHSPQVAYSISNREIGSIARYVDRSDF